MAKQQKPKPDARQIAATAVQEWYDALIQSADAHTDGHIYQVSLGEAFDKVTDALEAEEIAKHEQPSPDDEDVAIRAELRAREAGYLIGVQVGLRLRAAC